MLEVGCSNLSLSWPVMDSVDGCAFTMFVCSNWNHMVKKKDGKLQRQGGFFSHASLDDDVKSDCGDWWCHWGLPKWASYFWVGKCKMTSHLSLATVWQMVILKYWLIIIIIIQIRMLKLVQTYVQVWGHDVDIARHKVLKACSGSVLVENLNSCGAVSDVWTAYVPFQTCHKECRSLQFA